MTHVPTAKDLLQATHISNDIHHWHVEGGVIQLTTDQLTLALEAAYDPCMEDWPAMVEAQPDLWVV